MVWRIIVDEKRHRDKFSVCLEVKYFKNKTWERFEVINMFGKRLLNLTEHTERAGTALQSGKSWSEEKLALLRVRVGMYLSGIIVRQAMKAGEQNDWLEFSKSRGFNAWTRVKIQECCDEVRQQDDERKSFVQ